jgi:peptidyl-prolyl cis-trans isomerase B (cyclophilin B)
MIELKTNYGTIILELDFDKAPASAKNFSDYVERGHYDGTLFHRVIDGFMIQGGGFEPGLKQKPTESPVKNEADNGLSNVRGTIAMARTMDPHSASAQFFINVGDNLFLDHKDKSPQGWGYAVFGRVVDGDEVIDRIRQCKTGHQMGHQDVPVDDVVIETARIIDDPQDTA